MNSKRISYGIPGALLNLGLCLEIPILFPHGGISCWLLLLWSLAIMLLLLSISEVGYGRWLMPGILLALAGALLIFQKPLLQSFGCLINDLQQVWIRNSRRVMLTWDAGEQGIAALLILALLVQMLLCLAMITGITGLLLLVYLSLALLLAAGYGTPLAALALCLLSLFLFLGLGRESAGMNARDGMKKTFARISYVLITGALVLGILTAGGLGHANQWADGLNQYFTDRLHESRYDSDSNSMPEGNLMQTGEWEKSDTPALEVTMEKPEKAYIRGHVYNEYTGSSWKESALKEPSKDSALFYWLHKQDFYGQTQLSKALSLVGSPEWSRMTVKNLSACKENSYIPYGYGDSSLLEAKLIGDENTAAGAESYIISSGGLSDWYQAQKNLVAKQDSEELKEYLSEEAAYRSYVYEENLDIPDAAAEVLKRQLGSNEEQLTMDVIQNNIYDYLSTCMTYKEDVDPMTKGDDFLEYLLEETQQGYSVHYATAAVLMLRYYGVPARYVEGYFLSKDDAARLKAGETLQLTEENAHAWAEYYLDGVGFVPFEVTPGYIDEEDLENADEADGNSNNNQYAGKRIKSKDYEKPEVEPKEEDPGALPLGIWILIGILLLLLLMLLAYIISRRLKLKHFLQSLEGTDVAASVAGNYAYAMLLMEQVSNGREAAGTTWDEQARKLNEEAMFSNHPMSVEQRDFMISYRKQVLADCKNNWSLLQKIKYKLFKGIY